MAVKLSMLIPQNPWWKKEYWEKDDPDLRKVDYYLEKKDIDIQEGKLTVMRGIRRSGKTVYLKRIIGKMIESGVENKKILYLSCDRFTRGEVRNIVSDFIIKRGGGYLLLDEVTYMEGWNLLLKELMEKGNFTVIATGSNPVQIKDLVERLPGRGVEGNEYYFNPLSFREFVLALVRLKDKIGDKNLAKAVEAIKSIDARFSPIAPQIEDLFPYYEEIERVFYIYLFTGGFPDAISDYLKTQKISEETYEMLMRVILGTTAKDKKSEEISRVIMEKALSLGPGRTDFISIGKDVDLHHNTVRDYLGLLENSRVIYILYPWDIGKKRHSIRKQKKIVFQSALIPAALNIYLRGGGWEEAQDFVEKNIEWLVEDVIASHIIWTEERPVMREKHSFAGFFYNARECDFVMLKDNSFCGFESKYGKLERGRYPFKTFYLTKDIMDDDVQPTSLFLLGLEKGLGCI
jgi:predicted AAA+ superfamily ATPase